MVGGAAIAVGFGTCLYVGVAAAFTIEFQGSPLV